MSEETVQSDACELGWIAGMERKDPRSNPYDESSQEWADWNRFHAWGLEWYRGMMEQG